MDFNKISSETLHLSQLEAQTLFAIKLPDLSLNYYFNYITADETLFYYSLLLDTTMGRVWPQWTFSDLVGALDVNQAC